MKKENIVYSYTIESHPNPAKVYDWIRGNWHDLGEHVLHDFIESFKAVAKALNTTFDYSVSIFPDRGEFLELGDFDPEYLEDIIEGCSLTGICYDDTILEALKGGDLTSALNSLHAEGEYIYSDEGLRELCEANEYEFTASGSIFI